MGARFVFFKKCGAGGGGGAVTSLASIIDFIILIP